MEAVDTKEHWAAAYLPDAGIPIVRGWYRQSDFPQNELLYDKTLGPRAYEAWLRSQGVRYVLLPDAQPDYSALNEASADPLGQDVARAGLPLGARDRLPAA